MSRITVLGDSLLDRDVEGEPSRLLDGAAAAVLDERRRVERPGGAALAATLLASDGHQVVLVTAIAEDDDGARLTELITGAGVQLIDVGADDGTCCKQRVLAGQRPLLRLDHGSSRPRRLTATGRSALESAEALLVADYGLGLTRDRWARAALATAAAAGAPLVWDPHPRGAAPIERATLVTPNRAEASLFSDAPGIDSIDDAEQAALALTRLWQADAVSVTLDSEGALLASEDRTLVCPAKPAEGDTCGAGDRFATAAIAGLAAGLPVADAVTDAVAGATEFVRRGGLDQLLLRGRGGPAADAADPWLRALRAGASGRRIVATGGCFDILHPGHVATLRRARRLGDYLVVLLNSDSSVRRLKGPGRPIVEARHRAELLEALECVDCVIEFDAPTPVAELRRLKPDVFVKGGDYRADDLPETAVVEAAGGEVVIVPLEGMLSTTGIVERVLTSGPRAAQ